MKLYNFPKKFEVVGLNKLEIIETEQAYAYEYLGAVQFLTHKQCVNIIRNFNGPDYQPTPKSYKGPAYEEYEVRKLVRLDDLSLFDKEGYIIIQDNDLKFKLVHWKFGDRWLWDTVVITYPDGNKKTITSISFCRMTHGTVLDGYKRDVEKALDMLDDDPPSPFWEEETIDF